ncbi:hypothetical protein PENTCL1PPCAC_4117, partial [Pristionchus entomophagus]
LILSSLPPPLSSSQLIYHLPISCRQFSDLPSCSHTIFIFKIDVKWKSSSLHCALARKLASFLGRIAANRRDSSSLFSPFMNTANKWTQIGWHPIRWHFVSLQISPSTSEFRTIT